jgi:hypothetical protein
MKRGTAVIGEPVLPIIPKMHPLWGFSPAWGASGLLYFLTYSQRSINNKRFFLTILSLALLFISCGFFPTLGFFADFLHILLSSPRGFNEEMDGGRSASFCAFVSLKTKRREHAAHGRRARPKPTNIVYCPLVQCSNSRFRSYKMNCKKYYDFWLSLESWPLPSHQSASSDIEHTRTPLPSSLKLSSLCIADWGITFIK